MAQPKPGAKVRKTLGQLRHRVELQEAVKVIDELNGNVTTQWPVFGRDLAAIDVIPFVVNETSATMLYDVTIRHRDDVVDKFKSKKTIRIVGGGETLKLLAIEDIDLQHVDLVLHCGLVSN